MKNGVSHEKLDQLLVGENLAKLRPL